jgi:hypothetical protein
VYHGISPAELDAMVAKSITNVEMQKPITIFKMHKAASTTLAAIAFRYAARHGHKILTVNHEGGCWPQSPSTLESLFEMWGNPSLPNHALALHPGIAPKPVNLLWDIVVENATKLDWCRHHRNTIDIGNTGINHVTQPGSSWAHNFSDTMEYFSYHTPGSLVVTSLREPLKALSSYLRYFDKGKLEMLEKKLDDGEKVKCADVGGCNHQATELGIRSDADLHLFEEALHLGKLVVVLVDHWVDSMLLLKKVSEWHANDCNNHFAI